MTRLVWGIYGKRFYEAGVDRGVLYVEGQPGVAWNGLISVEESPTGGEAQPYYIDGVKYLNTLSAEEFEATISAFTYPDEFAQCDGTEKVRPGLFASQQRRKPFNFCYRTKVGADQEGLEHAYKIHLVYNALASPTSRPYSSISDSTEPIEFEWNITTCPPVASGYKRTSHIEIDSRQTDPLILELLENILYGDDENEARLPEFDELLDIFDTIVRLTVTDNGDGTFTLEAPNDALIMLDETTFQLTWPSAIFLDEDTYQVTTL